MQAGAQAGLGRPLTRVSLALTLTLPLITLTEIYDPDTLKQHFHTEPDERIRQKDVPERLQIIFEKREAAVPNAF